MGYFVFVKTTKIYSAQKVLAMLVVAVAKKTQRNRFMLELRAGQRYECDRLKTEGLVHVLSRCELGVWTYIQLPPMRLPHDTIDTVVRYLYALEELALKRLQREFNVAQWLAYHQLFAYGAALSVGLMDWRLVGFHWTITVDGEISGPPNYLFESDLTVGTYLRLYWNRSIECDAEGEITSHGFWRMTNYLSAETNPHQDIGFLNNVAGADNRVNYDGVVVCIYSKLPMETLDRQVLFEQYDVVIMGKSDWYCYDKWEELYWPFTGMVCFNHHVEETNQL